MFRTAIALAPKKKLTRAAAAAASKAKKAKAAKKKAVATNMAFTALAVDADTAAALSAMISAEEAVTEVEAVTAVATQEVAVPMDGEVAAKFDVVDLAAEESAAPTESITENDDACFTADTHQAEPTEAAVDVADLSARNEAAEVEAPALSEEEALAATEDLEALGTYSAFDVAPAEAEVEEVSATIDAEPTVVAPSADVVSMDAAFDVAPAEADVEAAPAVIEAVEAEPTIAAVSAPAAEETIEAASAAPAEISEAPAVEVTEAAAPFEFRPVW